MAATTNRHIGIISRLITLLWGYCGLFHQYILKVGEGHSTGLECFYKTSLKPIISYACPTWYTFFAEKDETELERLQKTATKNIDERIPQLHLPDVNNFFYFLRLITTSLKFMKTRAIIFSVVWDLHTFNTSFCKPLRILYEKCRTEKCKKIFSIFYDEFQP